MAGCSTGRRRRLGAPTRPTLGSRTWSSTRIEDLVEAACRTYMVGLASRGPAPRRSRAVPVSTTSTPLRYEWAQPMDMIHVDVKKIGRIRDVGGWAVHGRGSAQHKASKRGPRPRAGYVYLHSAVDDHSRLAYKRKILRGGEEGESRLPVPKMGRPWRCRQRAIPGALLPYRGVCAWWSLGGLAMVILRMMC